jgi:hypothetical protein
MATITKPSRVWVLEKLRVLLLLQLPLEPDRVGAIDERRQPTLDGGLVGWPGSSMGEGRRKLRQLEGRGNIYICERVPSALRWLPS